MGEGTEMPEIGGEMADFDFLRKEEERMSFIKEDRERRLKKLAGKFIVITKGKSSGKRVYFQDQRISRKGYWTQFLSNAYGFYTLKEAKKCIASLKFNSPKIAIVMANGNYTILSGE